MSEWMAAIDTWPWWKVVLLGLSLSVGVGLTIYTLDRLFGGYDPPPTPKGNR